MADDIDDFEAAVPARLCECGRQVDLMPASRDSLLLVLVCPEHGEVGILDPFAQ